MKTKKTLAGASMLLALFINFPQVSADELTTFDDEFEEDFDDEDEFADEDSDDYGYDYGPVLIFNDPEKLKPETPPQDESDDESETENPSQDESDNESEIGNKLDNFDYEFRVENPLSEDNFYNDDEFEFETDLPPIQRNENPRQNDNNKNDKNQKKKKVKTQKPRFVKLAIDDTYTYYLDKQSAKWERVPYSANEYMLNVWIRMVERNSDTSDLPEDLADYIDDTNNGELEMAKEEGIEYAPADVEVLKHKKYFLKHYYMRPKKDQVQLLSAFEVVGNSQNEVREREYDNKNWRNLIPDSIDSIIYYKTIKAVGKSGSSERGHMTVIDMIEEYGRISLR